MKNNNAQINKEPKTSSRSLALTALEDFNGFAIYHSGRFVLFAVSFNTVLIVLLIFYFVIQQGLPFFKNFDTIEFFTSKQWYPEADNPKFGALSIIFGSLYVTISALLLAVPAAILAAVFLSEIVSHKIRNYVKPVIELLAAIPSVAYGFFAVLVLAPFLQTHFGLSTGTNALNASLILSIMALPTIISVAEDSITAIGRDLREASYGLGATRFETIFKVVIPAAHSGIIAAIVLGMMRAIGETMVVWMASGNANQIPSPWWDLTQSVRTMTATIAGDMGETSKGSPHYQSLFAIGIVLLAMTFLLNIISEYFLASAGKNSRKK
ncbi:MAG TPA: phosphate ABC transporter permease subunit PstC [Phycisphaerales bacterium]|nr:phosphate ABC transporter permease subunit PstC [Phycisphaerales bacterium]